MKTRVNNQLAEIHFQQKEPLSVVIQALGTISTWLRCSLEWGYEPLTMVQEYGCKIMPSWTTLRYIFVGTMDYLSKALLKCTA